MKSRIKIITVLALAAAVAGTGGAYLAFAEGEQSYYVCYSTENYAVRNSNKMKEEGGEYYLYDVTLNSRVEFYVTDNAGRRWYASDGGEMSVDEAGDYSYNLRFSPDKVYDEAADGWEKTDCNITYAFYVPAAYSVTVGGEEIPLTYNPYFTSFDEYFVSSQFIAGGASVAYGEEVHNIDSEGYYRILFTAGERINGNDYAFNADGEYGTGEDYVYKLYIEDAPQYYLLPEGSADYKLLTRYENNVTAREYRSAEFFSGERDFNFKYAVYERDVNGTYRLIDDDNDEDTAVSKIKIGDVGWYEFSFTDGGSAFTSSCAYKKRDFGGFYLAGEFNGYGYGKDGGVDTDERFFFRKLEDGDDDYDVDYDQYELFFTVSEKSLKDGDVEFYITDGDEIYKNGTEYIKVSRAGTYRILFSDEKLYGNGRHYRYVLQDGEKAYTEIEIGTAEEFNAFAEKCTASADYSKNLAVYLTADIDFENKTLVSVGEFSGNFYGGYHAIKNVRLDKDTPSVFKLLKRDAVVERLTVTDLTLSDKEADYDGFVGKNYGIVRGITVYGVLTGNNYVGAVVGYNGRSAENETTGSTDTDTVYRTGKIVDCKNFASVSGTVHCGGVCGFNAGEIYNCENYGAVSYLKQSSSSTPFNLGGITGYSAGKITACTNGGTVYGGNETLYVGGICGLCTGEIYYSFNTAEVSGRRYSGGIMGYFGTLSDNNNDSNEFFGGLSYEEIYDRYFGNDENNFEQASGTNQIVKYCKNTGAVSSVSYAGGVAGYSETAGLKISCCVNAADVTVMAGSYAGGICGFVTGAAIDSCITSGKISAKGLNAGNYVGGIVGYGNGITACSSVCDLIGSGYIGGIAGYNQSGLSACWANVLLIPGDGAENVGNIAGFTEALNEGADNFASGFENNYYVVPDDGTDLYGGVCGRSYCENFGYAAAPVKSGVLAYTGTVSPLLSDGFAAQDKWQGCDRHSYPVPRYLIEADECAEFDDDELFTKLFKQYEKEFSAVALDNAEELFTVSFLEWNEDNGALYDDGELQPDNFDVIFTVRVHTGDSVIAPAFKWAYEENGKFVYDGDDASYFVAFPAVVGVNGNITAYAEYREIARTVATDDERVLVEGRFDIDTEVELVQSVNGYSLKFTLNGEQIQAGEVTVKFLPDGGVNGRKVEIYDGNGLTDNGFEISGEFLSFSYSDGQYFALVEEEKPSGIPAWAWAVIGGVIGAAAVAAAFAVPAAVKKVKMKRREK